MVAANTSFQDKTKVKMAAAASPGSAMGSVIRVTACTRLLPRVIAASSSSYEIATKMPVTIVITNGTASAVWTSATPTSVSYSPQRMKATARGIARIVAGNIFVASTKNCTASRPRNRYLASAYAAGAETTNAMAIVIPATARLFQVDASTSVALRNVRM